MESSIAPHVSVNTPLKNINKKKIIIGIINVDQIVVLEVYLKNLVIIIIMLYYND